MRQLTKIGFMKIYLKELSISNTSSIYKLIKEIPENPKIIVPLAYYVSMLNNKEKYCKKNELLDDTVRDLFEDVKNDELDKIQTTYQYASQKKEREDYLKKLMHRKIIMLMNEKNITKYKIYTKLSLDPSNTNKFLKDCDCDRISIENVRLILDYVKNI